MFTGLIESIGTLEEVASIGKNRTFWIRSQLGKNLSVDQSLCHDGVCLTVEELKNDCHRVTAVAETLKKSNLNNWKSGHLINLERSLSFGDRLEGHLVQGHVDARGECLGIEASSGSWEMIFSLEKPFAPLMVEKGSIAINGVSLTAFSVKKRQFKVAIIPYTFDHTNLHCLKKGSLVNLEFDLIGKYINRIHELGYK